MRRGRNGVVLGDIFFLVVHFGSGGEVTVQGSGKWEEEMRECL